MLTLDSRLLTFNGKYKSGHELRIGDTLLSAQGHYHHIVAIEKLTLPCYRIKTQNWYTSTHVIASNEVLDHSYLWKHPYQLKNIAAVPMKKVIGIPRQKLHKMSNSHDIGTFLGHFLAVGGFNEDNGTPFIMTGKNKEKDINMYLSAYPFGVYTASIASNLLYLDKSLQSLLCELVANPELFVLANHDKIILLSSLRNRLAKTLRESLNTNLRPQMLELIYLVDQLTLHKYDAYLDSVCNQSEQHECLYLDIDSSDEYITFIVNNMLMRRKLL